MVYIYKNENNIIYTRKKPQNVQECIILKRMLPIPQKNGYITKLKADFETQKLWFEFEKIPPTPFEEKETELQELKSNLQNTFDLLIRFLEGDIDISEYTETKKERQRIRGRIKTLEAEISALKGENDG